MFAWNKVFFLVFHRSIPYPNKAPKNLGTQFLGIIECVKEEKLQVDCKVFREAELKL